jgi:hypothetical protein
MRNRKKTEHAVTSEDDEGTCSDKQSMGSIHVLEQVLELAESRLSLMWRREEKREKKGVLLVADCTERRVRCMWAC